MQMRFRTRLRMELPYNKYNFKRHIYNLIIYVHLLNYSIIFNG